MGYHCIPTLLTLNLILWKTHCKDRIFEQNLQEKRINFARKFYFTPILTSQNSKEHSKLYYFGRFKPPLIRSFSQSFMTISLSQHKSSPFFSIDLLSDISTLTWESLLHYSKLSTEVSTHFTHFSESSQKMSEIFKNISENFWKNSESF